MANFNKKISDTNVRLGLVRFAYVHVFERRRNLDGTPGKYEVVCIIPKKDTETVKLFNEAFEAAKAIGVSTKWNGKMPKNLTGGLRDGDGATGCGTGCAQAHRIHVSGVQTR